MIAFGFGFFGIPMFLAAIGFGIYYHNDAEYRMDIFGQVIDYDSYNDANGVTQYTPVISYALDDKEYTCKGTVYQSPPEYAIGDVIPLQVHPEDPESVYIDTFSERWLVVVILGSVSFVFIILMLVFTFMSRRLWNVVPFWFICPANENNNKLQSSPPSSCNPDAWQGYVCITYKLFRKRACHNWQALFVL